MVDKFENVKVGDKLMKYVMAEINTWGRHSYLKGFYIEVEVERVTKTQITVDGNRYKKDGRMIGNSYSRNLFFKGEEIRLGYGDEITATPTQCQRKEYLEHKQKLSKVIRSYEINVLTKCENLDDAVAVSDLIRQIESIVNKQARKSL